MFTPVDIYLTLREGIQARAIKSRDAICQQIYIVYIKSNREIVKTFKKYINKCTTQVIEILDVDTTRAPALILIHIYLYTNPPEL